METFENNENKTQINIKLRELTKQNFENMKNEEETNEDLLNKLMSFYKQNNVKNDLMKVNFNFYDNIDKTLEETLKSSYNSILSSIHSHTSILKNKEIMLEQKAENENEEIKLLEEKVKELETENLKIKTLEYEKKDLEIQLEEKLKIIKGFEILMSDKFIKLAETTEEN
jgi:hypothetical protein